MFVTKVMMDGDMFSVTPQKYPKIFIIKIIIYIPGIIEPTWVFFWKFFFFLILIR